MTRTYDWEEIKSILKLELQKTKHILTYGTIGSCNIEHDIDTIITKKPTSPSSLFFREIHEIFYTIDKYLQKKHNAKLIRISRFSDEEETKYIGGFKENDLVFHVLTYVSFKQIEMHWYADTNSEHKEKGRKILICNYSCIIGNVKNLFKSNFSVHKNEYLFIYLNDSDKINSHFPTDFLVNKMNILFDFILQKGLGLKSLKAKNRKEIRKKFYKICDLLDK